MKQVLLTNVYCAGLRVCRIPGRGGCRLLYQDYEHDQTVREAHQVIHTFHFLGSDMWIRVPDSGTALGSVGIRIQESVYDAVHVDQDPD